MISEEMKKNILFVTVLLASIFLLDSCSLFKNSSKRDPNIAFIKEYYKAVKKQDSTTLHSMVDGNFLYREYSGHPIITTKKNFLMLWSWNWAWDTDVDRKIISSANHQVVVEETQDNEFIRYMFDEPLSKQLTFTINDQQKIVHIQEDTLAGFKPYIKISAQRATDFATWVQKNHTDDYKYFAFSSKKSALILKTRLEQYLKSLKSE